MAVPNNDPFFNMAPMVPNAPDPGITSATMMAATVVVQSTVAAVSVGVVVTTGVK
jgi:hypothetical protein